MAAFRFLLAMSVAAAFGVVVYSGAKLLAQSKFSTFFLFGTTAAVAGPLSAEFILRGSTGWLVAPGQYAAYGAATAVLAFVGLAGTMTGLLFVRGEHGVYSRLMRIGSLYICVWSNLVVFSALAEQW